jgi:hypothetical protein
MNAALSVRHRHGMEKPMRMRWLLSILVFLGLAIGSIEARATLLYAGGEDIDFTCNGSGSCGVFTGDNSYRSGWARESYSAVGTTSDPPTNRFATSVFSANSTLWIHAQYCNDYYGCASYGGNSTASGAQMLRILDSSGNPTLIVRGTGTAGQLVISSRTSAGAFTDLVTCSSAFNISLTQLDLKVNYGTSGEVTLYNSSVQVCDFTGDVTNGDGATTLNQVEFASPSTFSGAWSEVIISTNETRAMARFTANTTGDGNATGFSGTNICSTIWNATSFNDANYGYSGSNGVLHECTINSSIPPGVFNVVGLVMSARVLVGSSGPLHFDFLTRTGGADYASSDFAPTPSFSNIANYIQTINPATSSPWSAADFSAAGFNVGEETKP